MRYTSKCSCGVLCVYETTETPPSFVKCYRCKQPVYFNKESTVLTEEVEVPIVQE